MSGDERPDVMVQLRRQRRNAKHRSAVRREPVSASLQRVPEVGVVDPGHQPLFSQPVQEALVEVSRHDDAARGGRVRDESKVRRKMHALGLMGGQGIVTDLGQD